MSLTSSNLYGITPTNSVKNAVSNTQEVQITGFRYPINDRVFQKSFGVGLIQGQVRQLFNTSPGERVMLPGYGINLKKYLFRPLDGTLTKTILKEVTDQVELYIPNAQIVKFIVTSSPSDRENSTLRVKLTMADKKTNEIIPLEFDV